MEDEGGQWKWGKALCKPHCSQDVPPESGSAVCMLSDVVSGPKGPPPMRFPMLTILSRWGRHLSASWMVKLTLSPPGSALASPRGCLSPPMPASRPGPWTSLGSWTVIIPGFPLDSLITEKLIGLHGPQVRPSVPPTCGRWVEFLT